MAKGMPDYNVWSTPTRPTPAKGISVYTFDLPIPANTPEGSPTTQNLVLEKGTVSRFNIIIPPGHAALAGLQIYADTTQILPKTGWIKGDRDNLILDVDVSVPLVASTYMLNARGYNIDDTYLHTFYIRIWVLQDV